MNSICLSLLPVIIIDVVGSVATVVLALLMVREGILYHRTDPEDPLRVYMVWFSLVLALFATSRFTGHILRYLVSFLGHPQWWRKIAPFSGTINTVSLLAIAVVTFFFRNVEAMVQRIRRDGRRLEAMSREILRLNETLPHFISSRIKMEMALRLAHEIRNPVMVIGNMTHKLLRECTAGGKIKERLGLILREAEKLEDLVYQFENTMDGKGPEFEAVDINEIGERVVEDHREMAQAKGIALVLDRWASPLLVQGNGALLVRAAAHLVQNALDACSSGNSVEVATRLTSRGIVLAVRDDGPGIPQEVIDELFGAAPHEAGKPHLGLPYVRRVVEEHLGRLEIESRPGEGTEARIILPTHLGELQKGGR